MNTLPNIALATPEIFIFSMALVILLVDAFISSQQRIITYVLTQATLVVAFIISIKNFSEPAAMVFNDMFIHDTMASILKIVIYVIVFFVFLYSRDYLKSRGMYRGEYFVLGLFGVVGMMIMVSAASMLTIYMGLELMSLSLYAMVAFQRDSSRATEAAMKYFVLGAMASGMLLYGMSMIYGVTASLDIATIRSVIASAGLDNMPLVFGLVFILVGLLFKLGAVPFHMWVPDVYHGAPTSVTMYISSAPKLAAFAIIMRLLVGGLEPLAASWQDMLIIISILSMTVGNVVAIAQTNIKRMLAYSAISHMGFFLLGIISVSANGYSSSMIYVLIYAVMSVGAFGIVLLLSRAGFESEELADFKGLNQRSPWYAFLMLVLMFSMAGVPPTVGFWAKLMVIQAVVDADMVWLAIVAVLLAVIGAFYYLRIVKLMYFDDAQEDAAVIETSGDVKVLLSLNALAFLFLLPWLGVITDLCRKAIADL
ncbi:MAG: NADH-quinone oxidoreductase subunit NuoN [Acidiferrobacterales bacterium]